MKQNKIKIYSLLIVVYMSFFQSCKMKEVSVNAATDAQVLTTRAGIVSLSIGIRQYYSVTCIGASMHYPAVTSRESKGVSTTTTATELEAGGTAISTDNSAVLEYWKDMQHLMGMCENILTYAPQISDIESGMLSGVMAQAYLFKATSIADLVMAYEETNVQTVTNGNAVFVSRAIAMDSVVALIDHAIDEINTVSPSSSFTEEVSGSEFDLVNTIYAYGARFNLMAGNYAKAYELAAKVDQDVSSSFIFTSLSPNPLYEVYNLTGYYRPRLHFGLLDSLYDKNDGRLNFYFGTDTSVVSEDTTVSLSGFAASQTSAIPVYLPDEIKLIEAECLVRQGGDLSEAVTLIDAVRTQSSGDLFGVNAGLSAYSGVVSTSALLSEIYKQRCAELYMSGLKWEDTRRFDRPEPPAYTSERNRIYYPYPQQERDNNPNTPNDPDI